MTEARADGERITIVLADDHAVVRSGLRMLLEAEEDIDVLAEAGSVDAAQRYVLGHKPNVLVLDLNMPGGSSLDAIPDVADASPDTSSWSSPCRRIRRSPVRRCRQERADTC